ncbi:MAG: TetR/AcrR family transcriptional regulator [Alphaproteobacteria bacterium]|nr:TetR/AcrR family transcriptional regulator [Alphaproteobacteria bacterium]
MTRKYTLKRRAEQQAETRQRIVEAAVDLHSTVGPAATTISMVAERAGVQRHTLYAHFPDELSLLTACSGHVEEQDPLPDAQAWRAIADPSTRLRIALGGIYAWYARNASLAACVLRDTEHHPLVRQISAMRWGPVFGAYHEVLEQGLNERQRALVGLALSYYTWRTLTRDCKLTQDAAIDTMVQAVDCAK